MILRSLGEAKGERPKIKNSRVVFTALVAIVSGMGVAAAGEKNVAYLTVMDLAPTFLEIAGVEYPAALFVFPAS